MFVGRCGDTLRVDAPAKLNLFLEVIARRLDGFHEIETLMMPISLFDTLLFRTTSAGIDLQCEWARGLDLVDRESYGPDSLPAPPDNLVFKALMLVAREANVQRGATVRLVKRIPTAAGLGGASSDAAAVLLAANIAWELNWPLARLAELAANLGSDIPFFLYGSTAVCRGRGEQIERVVGFPRLAVVVVKPPIGLSTPAVYRACAVTDRPAGVQALLAAAAHGPPHAVANYLKNDLEPPARNLTPWIQQLRQMFDELSFVGHQMSGSGSSYFGICRNVAHARRMANTLRARRIGRVIQAETCHDPQLV